MNIKSPFILKQLIDHRQLFTQLVAYIEENDGDVEIPIRLYRGLVRQAVAAQATYGTEGQCQRIRYTLAEDNLLRERLIVRIDQARSTLVLAPFVVDMLRHFDIGRMRGLSQAELEDLREGSTRALPSFSVCQSTLKMIISPTNCACSDAGYKTHWVRCRKASPPWKRRGIIWRTWWSSRTWEASRARPKPAKL